MSLVPNQLSFSILNPRTFIFFLFCYKICNSFLTSCFSCNTLTPSVITNKQKYPIVQTLFQELRIWTACDLPYSLLQFCWKYLFNVWALLKRTLNHLDFIISSFCQCHTFILMKLKFKVLISESVSAIVGLAEKNKSGHLRDEVISHSSSAGWLDFLLILH